MSDARPPVAIRIVRPYASEEEFLANELETLSKTSIFLVGAQSRPQGVVLRFEVILQTGAPLVRGEGRVVGYKEDAFRDMPGLILRFTRLDTRSKALVDRAAAMRAERAAATNGPASPPPSPSRPSVNDVGAAPSSKPSAPSVEAEAAKPAPPPPQTTAEPAPEPSNALRAPGLRRAVPPANREELLDRLRSRAKGMELAKVEGILAQRRQ